MIARFGLLQKRPDHSTEAFADHWRDTHGPIAAVLPSVRSYQQNLIIDAEQRGITYQSGALRFDGFSQLLFDDIDAMRSAFTPALSQTLMADELHFLGGIAGGIVTEPITVIPVAEGRPLLKRMSTIKRRADISPEQFRHEWAVVHAAHLRNMPGVLGYRQNHVIERSYRIPGQLATKTADYDQLPIDGMVELWFQSVETLAAAFASPAGQAAMQHATTFIEEITTYLVEPRRIV